MEFSDKVIFPASVSLELRILNAPIPPLLILCPDRAYYNKVYCSVLEFSAEEDYIYVPLWIYKELGYKSANSYHGTRNSFRIGYGLKIFLAPVKENLLSYNLPKATAIKIISNEEIDTTDIKNAIQSYSVIKEGKNLAFLVKSQKKQAKILQVLPGPISLVSEELEIIISKKSEESEAKQEELLKNKESSQLLALENLPPYPEKYPKFLIDIMSKQATKKTSKQRSRTHQVPLILFEEKFVAKSTHKKQIKIPDKLKSDRNPAFPIVRTVSKNIEQTSTPKVLNFNLPLIHMSKKKQSKSMLRNSVCIEKWFRPHRKPTRNFDDTPLEIFSQAKLSHELI